MTADAALETPVSPGSLYMATGSEVDGFVSRPLFTGDVLEVHGTGLVAFVQHPCAMRRGPELTERVVACEVEVLTRRVPPDWSTGDFARMFLPEFNDLSYSIEFDKIAVLPREDVSSHLRKGILSQVGVNLLMQRWIYHNARVVVRTLTLQEQTVGPFDEADLVGEACDDLVSGGREPQAALALVDAWLGQPPTGGAVPRRTMLNDAQQRSVVRQDLRRQVVAWLSTSSPQTITSLEDVPR